MKSFDSILSDYIQKPFHNSFTLDEPNKGLWVNKKDLINHFMKVNKRSRSQAYRVFDNQCKHWESVREGTRVFISVNNRKINSNYDFSSGFRSIKDVDKLHAILQAVNEEYPITQFLGRAKQIYEKTQIRLEISNLKNKIKELENRGALL